MSAPAANGQSIRDKTSEVQAQYLAEKMAKESKAPKAPKATAASSAAAPKSTSSRNQQSAVAGTCTPPPRVAALLRQAQKTPERAQYEDIKEKINALVKALEQNSDKIAPEKRKVAEAKIESLKAEIVEKGLDKATNYRLSDEAAAALASLCDWILKNMIDLFANNTISANKRTMSIAYTLDPNQKPPKEAGSCSLYDVGLGPFVVNLPCITGYNVEYEKQLYEECKARNKAKNEQEKEIKRQEAEALEALVSKGHTKEEATQMIKDARKKKAQKTETAKAPRTHLETMQRYFYHFINKMCGNHLATLHSDYEGINTADRTRQFLSQLIYEFIEGFGKASIHIIKSQTLSGRDVLNMATAMQKMAQRPASEIESLTQAIQTTLDRWAKHQKENKETKAEREQEKLKEKVRNMSEQELEQYKEKRRQEEIAKRKKAAEKAEKRAAVAIKEAEAAKQKAEQEAIDTAALLPADTTPSDVAAEIDQLVA